MREVILIEGLKTRHVLAYDYFEYFELKKGPPHDNVARCMETKEFIEPVYGERRIAPVHHIAKQTRSGRSDLYIAYTNEVQRLLEMPFDCMKTRADDAESRLHVARQELHAEKTKQQRMGFLDGLKFWWWCNW